MRYMPQFGCGLHMLYRYAGAALETAVLLLQKAGRTAAMRALCQRNQRL